MDQSLPSQSRTAWLTSGWLRPLPPILLGLGYFLAAYAGIELTRQAGNIASFWPPNAIMLAVLLGWPSMPRVLAFASCAIANILANMAHGDPLLVASGFMVANVVEVGIPLAFVQWMGCREAYVLDLKNAATLALGVLIGIGIASPIGAGLVTLFYGAPWTEVVTTWLAADLAGMLIFAPPLLCLGSGRHRELLFAASTRSRCEIALVGGLFIVAVFVVFVSQDYASPYLFIPVLLWFAARFGPALTAIACTVIAIIAIAATVGGGWDIFGIGDRGIGRQILDLQIFAAVAVVSFLPLAILFEERAHLIDRLQASEERYTLAVRGSGAGIWTWEAATEELRWSDRLKQMVGITDDAFTPDVSSFFSRLHPDDRERVMENRRRHLVSSEPYDVECRLRREDGDYIWIHNRGQAVWDDAGKPIRMAGSAEDITRRKTAEAESAQYANELERSNRELDDFAYIASHDLKEPLRAIHNHAGFLLEDYGDQLDDDAKKRLNRLGELSGRMERLIADLLHFARLGQGMQSVEAVDLDVVLADIEESLAETLRERHAKLVITATLPNIRGHRPHIMALFQNLISNGIKYNDSDEKRIEIGLAPTERADSDEGFRTLYVRDNGIGIEDRFHDDVFRIFKRLNSEKAYGAGTGAGLSFVKKIVENLGGKIWLTSKLGEGTTFFLALPVGEQAHSMEADDQAA